MQKTFEEKSSFGVVLGVLAAHKSLRHAFATKKVADENRLAQAMGQEGISVVSVRQVHGDGILVLDQPAGDWVAAQEKIVKAEGAEGYDAIITNQPGVILAVRTADCVPVLIFDPEQRVIAAVHAGWRGTLRGVVPKSFAMHAGPVFMPAFRDRRRNRSFDRSCCYEVGEMVLAPLAATVFLIGRR